MVGAAFMTPVQERGTGVMNAAPTVFSGSSVQKNEPHLFFTGNHVYGI